MVKAIEVIVVLTLLVFSFFAGVKYSDSIKNHASWLFEAKEEEVELPDLSNESGAEIDATIGENGENLDNGNMMMEVAPEAAPTEAAAPTPAPHH